MGYRSKISWCDSTWNPVTGCLHGCEYCYARKIAERFGGCWRLDLSPDTNWRGNTISYKALMGDYARHSDGKCHVLDEPEIECAIINPPSGYRGNVKPYPYYFDPTFHRYKLDEPQKWKKPRTIFVCSMADLFGEWVPDAWIQEVFSACEKAPQHRYMFLTKNPGRFKSLRGNGIRLPESCWIGTSVTTDREEADQYAGRTRYISDNWDSTAHWFVSVEPILEQMSRSSIENLTAMHWVIVGAETGNRKGRVIPEKEWIAEIADECKRCRIPIFMKDSLRELMGVDFRQEFPWEGEG